MPSLPAALGRKEPSPLNQFKSYYILLMSLSQSRLQTGKPSIGAVTAGIVPRRSAAISSSLQITFSPNCLHGDNYINQLKDRNFPPFRAVAAAMPVWPLWIKLAISVFRGGGEFAQR